MCVGSCMVCVCTHICMLVPMYTNTQHVEARNWHCCLHHSQSHLELTNRKDCLASNLWHLPAAYSHKPPPLQGWGLEVQKLFTMLSCSFLFVWDWVSLCISGCPGTHSADQAGLKLRDLPASAFQVFRLKICATTAWLCPAFTRVLNRNFGFSCWQSRYFAS